VTAQRPGTPGATRTCPHCRETILESAAVCPSCRHHLRFEAPVVQHQPGAATPLRVEGSIRNTENAAWEYSMVLTIRNDRGEEIARRVVGVGAVQPQEQRTFTLNVDMSPVSTDPKKTRH